MGTIITHEEVRIGDVLDGGGTITSILQRTHEGVVIEIDYNYQLGPKKLLKIGERE